MSQHDFNTIKRSDPDPTGTGLMGWSPEGVDLTKGAVHPVIHYKGRFGEHFLVADVYALPGQPKHFIILCPVCQNSLKIGEDRKAIDLDLERTPKFSGFKNEEIVVGLEIKNIGPVLSVEPFRCTWELEPSLRRSYGFGVCNWSVAIENNIARDV